MTRVVLCDGARATRALAKLDAAPLAFTSNDPSGAASIRIPSLPLKLRGSVPTAALDLLRIAAFAYWADQMVVRPVDVDVSGERWKRSFALVVPVLEPDLWRRDDVRQALASTLGYGTGDSWEFHFEPSRPETGQRYLFDADAAWGEETGTVLLFSGGTDSLCAAIEEAASGRRPLLVSHGPNPRIKAQQEALRRALEESSLDWRFPRCSVEVTKRAVSEKERTQRTRGFLYSAIGASVAAGFQMADVVVADNGFVSVALPLNGQTVGAKMSRTTHPRFQYLFNRLCSLVLPGISIRNPLLFRTRAEALSLLSEHGLQRALRDTSSCAAASRLPSVADHCGVCSQCVDRRIGVFGADLARFDTNYQKDLFLDELTGDGLVFAESYVRLLRKVRRSSADELLAAYVELTDCAVDTAEGGPNGLAMIVEMVRRQAETAQLAIDAQAAAVLPRLSDGDYSPTCLVRLSIAGAPKRNRKNWKLPEPRILELSAPEEAEFTVAHFHGRLPIVITGKPAKRASNVLEIDGHHIELADADFVLLLRLVQALYEAADGFVTKGGGARPGGLADEPDLVPAGIEQAIGRLRQAVQPVLGDLDPKALIEVVRGRVRLSTHRRFVEIHRERLTQHRHPVVQRVLSRIPIV